MAIRKMEEQKQYKEEVVHGAEVEDEDDEGQRQEGEQENEGQRKRGWGGKAG